MKPVFAKILDNVSDRIFATRRIERSYFTTEFHFHEEAQLTYVLESEGRRMIGDSIGNFYGGELTLLGANLPHVWHNDQQQSHTARELNSRARSMALFFHPQKITEVLSGFFDTDRLVTVFQLSQRGFLFYGETENRLKTLLTKMCESDGLQKLICLLEVFEIFCHSTEYTLLSSGGYVNTYQTKDNDRIDKVLKFVFDNYHRDISLDEVAEMVYMNKQAFCRYFKARTQKTLVRFINEVRIAQACRLMTTDVSQNVSNIAYQCGYNSLSNFNRFFKEIKGVIPADFKKSINGRTL